MGDSSVGLGQISLAIAGHMHFQSRRLKPQVDAGEPLLSYLWVQRKAD